MQHFLIRVERWCWGLRGTRGQIDSRETVGSRTDGLHSTIRDDVTYILYKKKKLSQVGTNLTVFFKRTLVSSAPLRGFRFFLD